MKPLRLLRLLRINKTTGGGTHWPAKVLHNIAQLNNIWSDKLQDKLSSFEESISQSIYNSQLRLDFFSDTLSWRRTLFRTCFASKHKYGSNLKLLTLALHFFDPMEIVTSSNSNNDFFKIIFFSSFSKVKVEWEKKTGSHWHDIWLLRTLGYLKKKSKTTFHGQFWN